MKRLILFHFFYLGLVRRPHVQRFHGVADGHVPVHTHHGQREGAGEHVVVVDRHHRLTQSVPERPEAQEHVGALETPGTRGMSTEIQPEARHREATSPLRYDGGRRIIQ